jgi:hypothetical protein
MSARKPNKRSSIYFGKDGWWHGWRLSRVPWNFGGGPGDYQATF